jgi:hypothetical protein
MRLTLFTAGETLFPQQTEIEIDYDGSVLERKPGKPSFATIVSQCSDKAESVEGFIKLMAEAGYTARRALSLEVIEQLVNGFDSEEYLVAAIKRYLRDDADKAELYRLDLSIEDVLNGRYGAEDEPHIITMFEKWNAKIGQKVFGQ